MSELAPQPIISVSGLRGIVGTTLTPERAIRYVAAFARSIGPGPIVLTRDGRTTGPMLADAIRAALAASGRDVLDADIAATPTTGVLVRHFKAAGGVQISASHNPPEYNGIKLFGSDGRVIDAQRGAAVRDAYLAGEAAWVGHEKVGRVQRIEDPHAAHLEAVLATVDVEAIRKRRFRVLLDSNHGAGSLAGRRLLEALGCQVILLGGEPDGRFEHTPEPTAENLVEVAARVSREKVDVGFCQDPDADRLALIDENGRYVGEEYTLAVTLGHALRTRRGPVVINGCTSRMSHDLAEAAGVACRVAAVGEANVTSAMLACEAVYGGEGNGGPIDPKVGFVRDSMVGMAQTLDAMVAAGRPLSAIVDALPRYAIHKTKVTLGAEQVGAAIERLMATFPEAKADRTDGLRLEWPKAWLSVRASNTEPIVRIIAETVSEGESIELCERARRVLEG